MVFGNQANDHCKQIDIQTAKFCNKKAAGASNLQGLLHATNFERNKRADLLLAESFAPARTGIVHFSSPPLSSSGLQPQLFQRLQLCRNTSSHARLLSRF